MRTPNVSESRYIRESLGGGVVERQRKRRKQSKIVVEGREIARGEVFRTHGTVHCQNLEENEYSIILSECIDKNATFKYSVLGGMDENAFSIHQAEKAVGKVLNSSPLLFHIDNIELVKKTA